MAGNYYRQAEHAFTKIERDMKTGDIPAVVLLCGSEDYLIDWYREALIRKYIAPASSAMDLTVMEGEDVSVEAVRESAETLSLMSERKMVVLQDFPPADGRSLKGFRDADVSELADYLHTVPEGSMILMTVSGKEEPKKRKNRIREAVEKCGKVYDFRPLGDAQLRGFIEKRLNASGKKHRRGMADMIASCSGYGSKDIEYSLYNLDNDLKKIIAHSGEEITKEDVDGILSANPENNVFAMLDAIGSNRKDEALRMLHDLLGSGTPVFNLLRLVTGQLELMLSVKEMKEEGLDAARMQKELGVHQFRVKKALALSAKYSQGSLRKMLTEAYSVDENIKTGLFGDRLAFEYFIARI